MSAKDRFVRTKPTVKFHPIYRQWIVVFPTAVRSRMWRLHTTVFFPTWAEAIKFATRQARL